MAGSTWPSFVAGSRAKASEVEAKFDWIEGDIVPMIGGTKQDATYDIGQSLYRFRDGNFSRNLTAGNLSITQSTEVDAYQSFHNSAVDYLLGIDQSHNNAFKLALSTSFGSFTSATNDAIIVSSNGYINYPNNIFWSWRATTTNSIVNGSVHPFQENLHTKPTTAATTSGLFTVPTPGFYMAFSTMRFSTTNTNGNNLALNIVSTNTTSLGGFSPGSYSYELNKFASDTTTAFKGSILASGIIHCPTTTSGIAVTVTCDTAPTLLTAPLFWGYLLR